MGKMKTIDFIADHIATSFDEELRESVENMLYEEGVIEELDDDTCLVIDEVMLQIGEKLIEIYDKK